MSLASEPQGAGNPKLPLGATIGLSYSTYFRNLPDVLRASWLWLVLVAPVNGAVGWLQASWFADVVAGAQRGVSPQIPTSLQLMLYVDQLVMLVAGVSVAVAWHRRIILGEQPGLSASNVITKNFWHYAGVGLAICLMIGVPLYAILSSMSYFLLPSGVYGTGYPVPIGGSTGALGIATFLLALTAAAIFLRFSLLFPARAAGDLGLTFKEAWQRSAGSATRIFGGIVACTLPPLLLLQVAFLLMLVGLHDPAGFASGAYAVQWALTGALSMTYYLLILPIGIGFLSHAYRHFFRPAESR